MKKIILSFLTPVIFFAGTATAQLYVSSGSTFIIQPGGIVTVQGDVTTNADIQGGGKVVLKGSANQNVNTNGFSISNLEMDNTANATITGNTRISSSILFTNGKISAGNFNVNFADVATSTGGGTNKFIETNGTGQVIKELTANVTDAEIPVGVGSIYRPAFITSSGTYSNANVGIKVVAAVDPNRPVSLSEMIAAYWPVTKTGVTGTVTVGGKYDDADISGTESFLRGYFYNGTDWSSVGSTNDAPTNRVSAVITAASGDVTGLDNFTLVKAKAFLMGAYVGGTNLMTEALRTTGSPGTNLIPSGDPYLTAPYNTFYTHVNNPITVNAPAAVFNDQGIAGDNITDWVFLELRNNATSGNQVLATRSALIQRDGDIVDVDGISPVTFNRMVTGNYTLAIRHRNHLAISTDPTVFQHLFGEVKSTAPLVDFTAATDAEIFGDNNAYKRNVTDNKITLWSGDANADGTVKYAGTSKDPTNILAQVLGFPGNTSGLYSYNSALGYFPGDINMDRKVKYSGTSPIDPGLILTNVLAYPPNTGGLYSYSLFTRQLPN